MQEQSTKVSVLIAELKKRLAAGESFDNRKFMQVVADTFGGSRIHGAYTSRDAYDVLETAVNQYLLEAKARALMQGSVEAAFQMLRGLVAQLPTQTNRTSEQTEFQQFSTPPTIAFLVAKLLDPQQDDVLLEPSAGTGALAIWPKSIGAKVFCNEVSERRRTLLKEELGFETFDLDGEIIDDLLPSEIVPTCVLMNPPFTATGGRVVKHQTKYGLLHVESALKRLAEGGRLVSILGQGASFEHSTALLWWKRIAASYNVRANFGLNGRDYAKYGTGAGLQLLIIDKIGSTPGEEWKEQLKNIAWGSAKSVEKAWEVLSKLPPRAKVAVAVESKEQAAGGTMFLPYVARKLKGGRPHPAVIVEPATMAAVAPPDITYRPHLPAEVVLEGKLSDIQLERVIYAGQRHEQRLPDGARGGFYVGDCE